MAKSSTPKKTNTTNTLGSILSYKKSINPSIGRWFNKFDNEKITPIQIISESVIGAVSNAKSEKKEGKKPQTICDSNPSRGDKCYLDVDATGYVFKFGIIITPDSFEPDSCNQVESFSLLRELSATYKDAGGYRILAEKYVSALLSGRILWRNRIAENKVMNIIINQDVENNIIVEMDDTYCYDRLLTKDELSKYVKKGDISTLIEAYTNGLSEKAVRLDIEVSGDMPGGMEIYPSQAFVGEYEAKHIEDEYGKKYGKVLKSVTTTHAGVRIRQAINTSVKIGNALRQIDDLRENTEEYGVTSIEVYGYARHFGMALRANGAHNSSDNPQCENLGPNLYQLLLRDKIEIFIKEIGEGKIGNDVHYLFACLIRGGVYGAPDKGEEK